MSVADPDIKKLEQLQSHAPEISIVTQNQEAVNWADVIILAVKPWLVSEVLGQLRIDPERQLLISIAAGVSLEQLAQITSSKMTIFRLVPNTAISEMASMTLISSFNASEEQERQIVDIFNEMGLAMLIPESQIAATTALTAIPCSPMRKGICCSRIMKERKYGCSIRHWSTMIWQLTFGNIMITPETKNS